MVHKKKKSFIPKEKPHPPVHNFANHGVDEQGRVKRARIIVRNLPFKNLSELKIKEFFEKYGKVVEVQLLRHSDGKFVGCGFVEFEKRQSASKAIFHTNGTKMTGRPIIVDWAFPKHTFVEKLKQLSGAKLKAKGIEGESDDLVEYTIDTKPDPLAIEIEEDDVKEEVEDNNDEYNDETEDDEMEEENDNDDFDDDDNDDFGEDNDEDGNKTQVKKTLASDVGEGKTVFIKNVPFAASNADLRSCVESFGHVVYALICIDKLTEHSKGTAFVKFKETESAEKCLKESKKIVLMEQALEVSRAVTKDQLEEERKKKKDKVKDSRNLYLIKEGVIMAGSPAAASVSAADMAKRLQIEQWKSQILRNLNMFVSRTRLVVHNIPPDYDDVKLRQLFEKYSPPNAFIKEARVMRDRKKLDGQGQGLSKELGFVTFVNNEDALHALRQINNNPNIFTPTRRPIISFSIENREILNLKQKRLERSRVKIMGPAKTLKPKGVDKLNSKQRRFLKRKQKIISKRQEAKKLKRENNEHHSLESIPQTSLQMAPSSSKKKDKGAGQTKEMAPSKAKSKEKHSVSEAGNKTRSKKKMNKKNTTKNADLNDDEFGGITAEPGKRPRLRSKLKLKKQAEIHKNRLKELKKVKKTQKAIAEKKRNGRVREPGMRKGKSHDFSKKDDLSKLISRYRNKIETAETFKKWYDN